MKRKGKENPQLSPHPSVQGLSGDQQEIAEGVFDTLFSIMGDFLDDQKNKLSQQFEVSLQRHRDEFDAALNEQNAEISLLNEDLKDTKDQLRIMEGRLTRSEKQVEDMREKMLVNEARSMRDNLVFYNIPETQDRENTEAVLRDFLVAEMKISEQDMTKIRFDRAHRTGQKQPGKHRIIVAKFNPSAGKDIVLKHGKYLDREKRFGVNEQLPRELEERKKQLLPKFHEARSQQKTAKWSLDKLIVGDKVMSVDRDRIRDINTNSTDVTKAMKTKRAPPMTYNTVHIKAIPQQ